MLIEVCRDSFQGLARSPAHSSIACHEANRGPRPASSRSKGSPAFLCKHITLRVLTPKRASDLIDRAIGTRGRSHLVRNANCGCRVHGLKRTQRLSWGGLSRVRRWRGGGKVDGAHILYVKGNCLSGNLNYDTIGRRLRYWMHTTCKRNRGWSFSPVPRRGH